MTILTFAQATPRQSCTEPNRRAQTSEVLTSLLFVATTQTSLSTLASRASYHAGRYKYVLRRYSLYSTSDPELQSRGRTMRHLHRPLLPRRTLRNRHPLISTFLLLSFRCSATEKTCSPSSPLVLNSTTSASLFSLDSTTGYPPPISSSSTSSWFQNRRPAS